MNINRYVHIQLKGTPGNCDCSVLNMDRQTRNDSSSEFCLHLIWHLLKHISSFLQSSRIGNIRLDFFFNNILTRSLVNSCISYGQCDKYGHSSNIFKFVLYKLSPGWLLSMMSKFITWPETCTYTNLSLSLTLKFFLCIDILHRT